MTTHQSLAEAISAAKSELRKPLTAPDSQAGWDDEHCRHWLVALNKIERYIGGDESERGFSIIRSLDSHGSDSLEHPRGQALMKVAAALTLDGITRYS